MQTKKAFTLIELLVVIAIIGILASIVLVSLTDARNRAKNKRITLELDEVRNMAEMIYNDNSNSYNGLCNTTDHTLDQNNPTYGASLGTLENDINDLNGTNLEPACYNTDSKYCVSVADASGNTVCIGEIGQIGNDVCTAVSFTCTP